MKNEVSAPNKVALGWLEHGTRKDAIEYAKGYATKHFDAPRISWYSVLPVLGGWLFEVQEGGPGRSHLAAVAKALAEGAELSWFRVGQRAFTVQMRDGRPFCVLLPVDDSKDILASETGKLQAKGKMELVVKRGTTVLAVGITMFTIGALFMGSAQAFHVFSQQFVPQDRSIDPDTLPHRQWSRVESIPPNLFVESLRIDPDGEQWQAVVKPIQPPDRAETPAPVTGEDGNPILPGQADAPVTDAAVAGVPVPETVLPGESQPVPVDQAIALPAAEPVLPGTNDPLPVAPVPVPVTDTVAPPIAETVDAPITQTPDLTPPAPIGAPQEAN